jgi:uncharacterized protein YhfF
MTDMKSERTDRYWNAFREATGHTGANYDVVVFGDSPELIAELTTLVCKGQKRATAGLLRDYVDRPDAVPKAGDHVVVVDSAGDPVCIYRSTEVRIGPLISVDDAFAWDEGEGDRSRDDWLAGHRNFFMRQAAAESFTFSDSLDTVFERFTVIWPRELADNE